MKTTIVFALFMLAGLIAKGQKYAVEQSTITFFSDAPIEDIKADNKKATGILDATTGEIVFAVPISEFQFQKSLMQEHFNEKYMESDKYPRSTFQGTIEGFDKDASGEQQVKAVGKLTIHGVTNNVELPGTIEKNKKGYAVNAKFKVKLKDYDIAIPQLLWQNIAEVIEVTTEFSFKEK